MPSKRSILETLTRAALLDIATTFEVGGLTARPKEEVIDGLMRVRSLRIEQILDTLNRDQLKDACRALGLDEYGREKQVLIARLLGNDGATEETDESLPADPGNGLPHVGEYRHATAKRKNNPPAKIAAEGKVPDVPKIEYWYSPRRQPILLFDPTGRPDKLPDLLEEAQRRALKPDEVRLLAEALHNQEPWLEWAGKRESQSIGFTVDPVALHIHERVSAKAILKVAARQDLNRSLFADPEQEYHEAVQFYRHDIDWTNRLILGDSLQVMASLARREDLKGKVQMIYIDPPYGIKFASNFQPQVGQRDVKDRAEDLTREPETVKAYRDTWILGVHSYLDYLRQRLIIARELLVDTGSIFVQISDENLHRVRCVMDEVFNPENFLSIVVVAKTSGFGDTTNLASVGDFLLWYSKDKERVKYRPLFWLKDDTSSFAKDYKGVEHPLTGERRNMTSGELEMPAQIPEGWKRFSLTATSSQGVTAAGNFDIDFQGKTFQLSGDQHWKTSSDGVRRLILANRIHARENSLRYIRYIKDFPVVPMTNNWSDLRWGFDAGEKRYVVETNPGITERCVLMTTDPGDLVLDPTCGSGTTAYVAEQRGRRWITCDTSRVALALARQRLMTARFSYYHLRLLSPEELAGEPRGTWLSDPTGQLSGKCTFKCKTVPHITLKSIARNTSFDPIYAKHEPILTAGLSKLNAASKQVTTEIRQKLLSKLVEKQQRHGKKSITEADRRRWELPKTAWQEWEVPFDTDPDWPKPLQDALIAYRAVWRAKMDEVNACITANADQEELVDQPEVLKGVVRVSGPFTVEAVQPPEVSLQDAGVGFGGDPDSIEGTFGDPDEVESRNIASYLKQMVDLLRQDGVRFPNNKQMIFTRLDPLFELGRADVIHAEGRWIESGEEDSDAEGPATLGVVFGPQYGPVTAKMVEEVIKPAGRRYDVLVIAGFNFDGPAQDVIHNPQHPKLRIHMANISPDVNPAMSGLLKNKPGSQLFTVFGQPRTKVQGPAKDGTFKVVMEGVDIFDPVANTVYSSGADKVAAWFIDGDYDGRTFCITQAFFPNRDAWDKLARELQKHGVVDPSVFEAFSGTVSLPFPLGKYKRVAVKVIDPRGNEVMQVHGLE